MKFFDYYSGQTVQELIKLETEFRIDSLVLAFEQAIDQKAANVGYKNLTKLEKAILAIESLEREVNNGGYYQFFINSSEFVADIVDLLKFVGLTKTAEITQRAIDLLEIDMPITRDKIEEVINNENDVRNKKLCELDDIFLIYEEDISGLLFIYIKNNQNEIILD